MEEKYLNKNINPGDDFYKYSTDNWIKYNKEIKDYANWNTFNTVKEDNYKKIKKIIKNIDTSTIIGKKISDYYNIISNWKRREQEGVEPLKKYLNDKISNILDNEIFIETLATYHIPLLFCIGNNTDIKNTDIYSLYISANGLTLGNKEYYLNKDKNNIKIYNAWKHFVINSLQLLGYTKEIAKNKFKIISKIEKQIAKVEYNEEEKYDPIKNYNKISVDELSKICKFNFNKFLKIYKYDNTSEVIVNNIEQLKLCCKILNTYDIEDLKTFAEYKILYEYSSSLNSTLEKLLFKFNKVLVGTKKMKTHEKKSIIETEALFSDNIGLLYCKKYFKASAKKDMQKLIDNLKIAFAEIINEQNWLSDDTKKIAINKLNNLKCKIGYHDKIDDISNIPIDINLSFFNNLLLIGDFFFEFNKNKYYNKQVDKSEWDMSPQEVNAYYDPTNNEICFPAGILQKPFYNEHFTDAEKYGSIGVIIGHEMTHGYDNHGRQFDINGNLNEWMSKEEIETFNELAKQTEENFNNIEVLPGLKCNGKLTLGENLADYGGLKIAWRALNNINKNLSVEDKKIFFISYAQSWAGIINKDYIKYSTLNNVHSINYMRVNRTLSTFTPWYEVFNIKNEDKLYLAKNKRAKIW